MYYEQEILNQNFLSQEHIDQIYTAFVNYCPVETNQLTLTRYSILSKEIYKTSQTIDEMEISKKFNNIISHDFSVNFQDFLKFIFLNLKMLNSDISREKKLERLNVLITDSEIYNFHSIIKDIIFPIDVINPFFIAARMPFTL